MKIRSPWLIRRLSWVVARLIRLWIGTLRFRYYHLGPDVSPRQERLTDRYIYAFWHENLLLPAYQYGRPDIWILISQHADGQLIAEATERLGFSTVRGSTTRGGVEAIRQLLKHGQDAALAITPDGPRGPRRQIQPGLIYLAARTGLPIVAAGFGYQRPWRMKSWDRFALPRPWSRAVCVTGVPIAVPADAEREQLEEYRRRVEDELLRYSLMAEQCAENGTQPQQQGHPRVAEMAPHRESA
jgi:lysophospholipid acyltransferase (LPLAT)-like uncharacterized protein